MMVWSPADCEYISLGDCDYTRNTEPQYSHCINTPPASPASPASPPSPAPPGGYDISLLCPPHAMYCKLNSDQMLEHGAVQVGLCWDLSAITNFWGFNNRFIELGSDQNLTLTGLGNVDTTDHMFAGGVEFNSPLSLEGLGSTGKWISANSMFLGAVAFNQPIDAIGDTSAVLNFANMFAEAEAFNQPVTALNTSSGSLFTRMFQDASSFSQELYMWDVKAAAQDWGFLDMFQNSLMSAEAASGGPGFGRACRLHYSWKAQNEDWNPVTAQLVATLAELDLSLCAPHLVRPPSSPPLSLPPPGASSSGDPHLAFAHGGTANFRGCEGRYFNMLSTQDLLVNVRTLLATFKLKGSTVHGSFLTEVHLAWHDAPARRWLNASFWAAEVGDHNFGWRAVNLTCGEPGARAKAMYYNTRRACGAANLTRVTRPWRSSCPSGASRSRRSSCLATSRARGADWTWRSCPGCPRRSSPSGRTG